MQKTAFVLHTALKKRASKDGISNDLKFGAYGPMGSFKDAIR